MKPLLNLLALTLLGTTAWAAEPESPAAEGATESSEGQWVFSLLPKAFQKNPLVDQTVITEVTDEGKKLPPPTPAHPTYYVAQPGGYHVEGHGPGGEHPPKPEILESTMRRALAVNGYQPAAPEHPPTIAILYHWGSHNPFDAGSDEIPGSGFADVGYANLLSRAALVGGTKFAKELEQALINQALQDEVNATLPPEFQAMMPDFGPLRLFSERDGKTLQLFEQAKATCYYVVASAYDYSALSHGQRKLLWRSKMTVDAQGIAMTDSLPSLILNAGRYFGRDMPEAATISKRLMPAGKVEIGTPEMKGYIDPPAGRQPANNRRGPP
jgi:hypothetical protein